MRSLNFTRAIVAGLGATATMTMLMLAAPLMGLPPMPIGKMLGTFLGIGAAAGWAMHFMIGAVLAGIYGVVFAPRTPGHSLVNSLAYAFGVFLMAQLVVMPMMGSGVFSGGNLGMIMGSLVGHMVFGAVLGAVYGVAPRQLQSAHA